MFVKVPPHHQQAASQREYLLSNCMLLFFKLQLSTLYLVSQFVHTSQLQCDCFVLDGNVFFLQESVDLLVVFFFFPI